jgi:hypothetical protein
MFVHVSSSIPVHSRLTRARILHTLAVGSIFPGELRSFLNRFILAKAEKKIKPRAWGGRIEVIWQEFTFPQPKLGFLVKNSSKTVIFNGLARKRHGFGMFGNIY